MSESIKELIKEKRPKLSNTSITTYASILKNLYEKVYPDDKTYKVDKFENSKKIIDALKDTNYRTRKTILSALFIISDNKDYRDLMLDDIKDYNNEIDKQEKDDKQKDSWISGDDINSLYKELENNAKYLYKKKTISPTDLQQIQFYIIISLLGGIYIPPRRSKDYVDFKIKNIDKEKDNYFDKDKLFFNSYKTAKTYGLQAVEIPKELIKILKKWISINPTDYLFFDSKLNKLSNVKLNQRLNKLFDGKKVGVNQLRHTFLTDKYQDSIKTNKSLKKDFKDMGSSTLQFETYIKKNDK